MYGKVNAAWHFDGKHFDADGRGRRKIALKQVDVHTRHAISLTHTYSPTLTPADGLRSQREVSSNEVVQRNSIFCSAVAAQAAACCSLPFPLLAVMRSSPPFVSRGLPVAF